MALKVIVKVPHPEGGSSFIECPVVEGGQGMCAVFDEFECVPEDILGKVGAALTEGKQFGTFGPKYSFVVPPVLSIPEPEASVGWPEWDKGAPEHKDKP